MLKDLFATAARAMLEFAPPVGLARRSSRYFTSEDSNLC